MLNCIMSEKYISSLFDVINFHAKMETIIWKKESAAIKYTHTKKEQRPKIVHSESSGYLYAAARFQSINASREKKKFNFVFYLSVEWGGFLFRHFGCSYAVKLCSKLSWLNEYCIVLGTVPKGHTYICICICIRIWFIRCLFSQKALDFIHVGSIEKRGTKNNISRRVWQRRNELNWA